MTKKEIKNIAKKLAAAETIIATAEDPQMIEKAKVDILRISKNVHKLEDLMEIDEAVQEILSKNS